MKRVISFALINILTISTVFGATETEIKSQLDKAASNIQATENEIKKVEKQQNSLLDEIETLDLEINAVEKEIANIQGQINKINSSISEKEQTIKNNQETLKKENELLQQRVWAMYENGEVSYLKLLLNSNGIVDFLKRYELVNSMIEADKELIAELTELSKQIEIEKQELENDKVVVEAAKKQEAAEQKKLATSRSAKESRFKLLEKDAKELQKQLDREREESERLEQELKNLSKTSTVVYDSSTSFIWPLPKTSKKITCQYGYRTHPVTGVKNSFHTGVDIGNAPTGTDIYAVKSGKVITAGWNTAYGNRVIIDHGNGITTMYAHASKLLVKVGDTVTQGQVIAKVGSTGYSTGPHLHFEVRKDGASQNPKNYINY